MCFVPTELYCWLASYVAGLKSGVTLFDHPDGISLSKHSVHETNPSTKFYSSCFIPTQASLIFILILLVPTLIAFI
ncbi:MAG: hypothetical protein JZU49_02540, partial [Sulfuricurvum sp.]|nr:hypothetical protein [Sulfuricurvum sp.]